MTHLFPLWQVLSIGVICMVLGFFGGAGCMLWLQELQDQSMDDERPRQKGWNPAAQCARCGEQLDNHGSWLGHEWTPGDDQ